jgi:hypothetical protein
MGGIGGAHPSDCNPKPATCAAVSEALHNKVSLRRSPPVNEGNRRRAKARQSGECHFVDTLNRRPHFYGRRFSNLRGERDIRRVSPVHAGLFRAGGLWYNKP